MITLDGSAPIQEKLSLVFGDEAASILKKLESLDGGTGRLNSSFNWIFIVP
jgi:hypothetical protein